MMISQIMMVLLHSSWQYLVGYAYYNDPDRLTAGKRRVRTRDGRDRIRSASTGPRREKTPWLIPFSFKSLFLKSSVRTLFPEHATRGGKGREGRGQTAAGEHRTSRCPGIRTEPNFRFILQSVRFYSTKCHINYSNSRSPHMISQTIHQFQWKRWCHKSLVCFCC